MKGKEEKKRPKFEWDALLTDEQKEQDRKRAEEIKKEKRLSAMADDSDDDLGGFEIVK